MIKIIIRDMVETSYFDMLQTEFDRQYKLIDSINKIKIPIAEDVAARIEGLLSVLDSRIINSGLAEFIRDREKKYGPNDWRVAMDSAIETAKSKFFKLENAKDAIEMGIRVGLAYITSAVVSAPLEGFVNLELKKRMDGGEYLSCFFSGPIRGAGGTAAASVLVIADALRVAFGLGKYDPLEEEINRMKVECTDYDEWGARLQYLPTANEIDFIVRNLPVEIDGDPTLEREVSAYKNTARIATTRVRGGVCLVLCEGFAQKAGKIQKFIQAHGKDYGIADDFAFIPQYVKLKEIAHSASTAKSEAKVLPNYRYLEEIAAGRPIFSYPLRSGGFRLRYGRARTSGLAAAAINPITNRVLSNFIATGSQLRVELPGKACAVTPCDSIDGPIVKFKDRSVRAIKTLDNIDAIIPKIAEILYLGDILFNYGDFVEQGHLLMPSPFVDEWWMRIVESKGGEAVKATNGLKTFSDYLNFSKRFSVPLHPKYIYFWSQLSKEQLLSLVNAVFTRGKTELQEQIDGHAYRRLIMPFDEKAKRALEILGVEHDFIDDKIIVDEADSLINTLGLERLQYSEVVHIMETDTTLNAVSKIAGVEIKDKAGSFIGARLGRPEKAKMRAMETNPSVIFPIGESGGNTRDIVKAANNGGAMAEYGIFFCTKCNRETIFSSCDICGSSTQSYGICRVCGTKTKEQVHHGKSVSRKSKMTIKIKDYLDRAYSRINIAERLPEIKGVKGVFNSSGKIEPLEKGILRTAHGLNVNKDGTIRFDAIEVPITHFKPKEIGTSVERLKELGYVYDVYGKELLDPDQILQLFSQDIIMPAYGGPDEDSSEVFVRMTDFIDDLLVRYYGKDKLFGVKTKESLAGTLVVGLAPHTSAGMVGRIIGFSKTQGLFAHPFFHAAMRRNCDGDEACIMLLADALLNFDRELLPDARGARYMDSPLVISLKLDVNGIDSEAYNLDIVDKYPIEFYEATMSYAKPSDIKIKQVKDVLKEGVGKVFFTNDTNNINDGVNVSSYKTLEAMRDKVFEQMSLVEKIRAVDAPDVARIIIEKHFIKDIKGNLRRFGTQEFRCVKCSSRYSRAPLIGKCQKCSGNIVLTSSEGNIKKYLYISLEIAQKYNLPKYISDELLLLKEDIDSIFGASAQKEASKQATLSNF